MQKPQVINLKRYIGIFNMEKTKITQYVTAHKNVNNISPNRTWIYVNESINKKINSNDITSWTKDNIDYLNPYFCELTALYWIWKNDDSSDIISFEHYRRIFLSPKNKIYEYKFLNQEEIEKILNHNSKYKIILPAKHYFKQTLFDQYKNNHYIDDLLTLTKYIKKIYPNMNKKFDEFLNNHYCTLFNMFIMSKQNLNKYCNFAFPLLDKIFKERKETINSRSTYQKRFVGFLAERLFSFWCSYNFRDDEQFHCDVALLEKKPLEYFIKDKVNEILGRDHNLKRTKLK